MKKIFKILLLLIAILMVSACDENKKEEEGSKVPKTEQELTIIEQDENGEIT